MANLGTIAVQGDETKRSFIGNPAKQYSGLAWQGDETKRSPLFGNAAMPLQALVCGSQTLVMGGEDTTTGNPAQPSLRMDSSGKWRFRWALTVGSHMISVNVLHAINQSPRPSLCIKANPAIGIPIDIETFAQSSTGWVTISSPTFTVTAVGATWVELRTNLVTNVGMFPAYWDHLVKS